METMPELSIENQLVTFWEGIHGGVWLLCGARLVGLTLTVPFFSSHLISCRFRIAFVVVLLVALVGNLPSTWNEQSVPGVGAETISLPMLLGSEVFIGMAIGWTALLVVSAAGAAAVLISEQIGFAFGGIVDPSTDQEEPVLGRFYSGLAVFVLLAGDFHHVFLRSVIESFVSLPPGSLVAENALAGLRNLSLAVGSLLFEATLILVFPVTAALFLASVAQGVLTRLFPELETVLFGFLLRSVVGLGVVMLALPFFTQACDRFFGDAVREGALILREFIG